MNCQPKLDEGSFSQFEKEILKEVMESSKSILETFKFRMIFGLNLDDSKSKKTSAGLKEFRKKKWDAGISRDQAYKKYLSLY